MCAVIHVCNCDCVFVCVRTARVCMLPGVSLQSELVIHPLRGLINFISLMRRFTCVVLLASKFGVY